MLFVTKLFQNFWGQYLFSRFISMLITSDNVVDDFVGFTAFDFAFCCCASVVFIREIRTRLTDTSSTALHHIMLLKERDVRI